MTSSALRRHFFISYNPQDEEWATWIASTLQDAGYSLFIQAWDARPGGNFVLAMQQATAQADRTIAVLSPDFLSSRHTAAEWAAAFARDPAGLNHVLIPVRVRPCELSGLLAQIIGIDLVGVDEATARERLLRGISDDARPRRSPRFPGAAQPATVAPSSFPASVASTSAAATDGPGPSRVAALRDRIHATLRTDSDLEAFCLDYFPHVKSKFSNGMDRTSKVTLLLQLADLDELAALLPSASHPRR